MAASNLAVLTNSHKIVAAKRRAKREQIKEVVFDDDARREFLTGFHKRKVQKSEAAKKKALERERQERLEARREKRQLLAERAAQNAAETEKAYGAYSEEGSDAEWSGISGRAVSPDKGEGNEKEEEYEYEEQLATVTVVEDFDPDAIIHGPDRSQRTPQSLELEPPIEPSSTSTAAHVKSEHSNNKDAKFKHDDKAAVHRTRSKTSARAKDVKYQTNAARKADRMKQRIRKTEKADRAGGKASRKSGGGRKKR